MKKLFLCLFFLHLLAIYGDDALERLKANPGLYLNFQDVPIFYTGNPLEGLMGFAVLPPVSIQDAEVNKKIQAIIEKELSVIGTVVKTKLEDVSGFGSGNSLNLQIGPVTKWEGGELPITRVTLNVETSVVVQNSHKNSSPRVWTVNGFVDAPCNRASEEKTLGAVEKLLKEFVRNYKFANAGQVQKPVFYVY